MDIFGITTFHCLHRRLKISQMGWITSDEDMSGEFSTLYRYIQRVSCVSSQKISKPKGLLGCHKRYLVYQQDLKAALAEKRSSRCLFVVLKASKEPLFEPLRRSHHRKHSRRWFVNLDILPQFSRSVRNMAKRTQLVENRTAKFHVGSHQGN